MNEKLQQAKYVLLGAIILSSATWVFIAIGRLGLAFSPDMPAWFGLETHPGAHSLFLDAAVGGLLSFSIGVACLVPFGVAPLLAAIGEAADAFIRTNERPE